jgi:predicted RNA-binding protein (virulence factor B family)
MKKGNWKQRLECLPFKLVKWDVFAWEIQMTWVPSSALVQKEISSSLPENNWKVSKRGRMTLVILLEDRENKRLYASTKLQRHLRNSEVPYKRGDEVSLTIAEKIDIGRRVVVDGKYIAVLFRQEITDKVRSG